MLDSTAMYFCAYEPLKKHGREVFYFTFYFLWEIPRVSGFVKNFLIFWHIVSRIFLTLSIYLFAKCKTVNKISQNSDKFKIIRFFSKNNARKLWKTGGKIKVLDIFFQIKACQTWENGRKFKIMNFFLNVNNVKL